MYERLLDSDAIPWISATYQDGKFMLPQDRLLTHSANSIQQTLTAELGEMLISGTRRRGPTQLPDLNQLSFCMWSVLE